MEINELIGLFTEAKTWQQFASAIVVLLIFVIVFVFKKYNKQVKIFFMAVIDRISGKKNENNLNKIISQIEILNNEILKNKKNDEIKRDEFNSKISNLTEKINENYNKSKAWTKDIFDKLDKLNSNQKIDIYVNEHNKLIYPFFLKFCDKNRKLNKNLKDIFEKGLEANILFFRNMLIIGLDDQSIDRTFISEKLKSNFRILSASNVYYKLGINNIDKFKDEIKEEITYPLINEFVTSFVSHKANKKNGELILEFSKINFKLVKEMILQKSFMMILMT